MKASIGCRLSATICAAILLIAAFTFLPIPVHADKAEDAIKEAEKAVKAAEDLAKAAADAKKAAAQAADDAKKAAKKAGDDAKKAAEEDGKETPEDKAADKAAKEADDAAKAADKAQDEADKQQQEADDAAEAAKNAGKDKEKDDEAAKQKKEAEDAAHKAKDKEDDATKAEGKSDEADKKADEADKKIKNRKVKEKKAEERRLRKKARAARRAAAKRLREARKLLDDRKKREGTDPTDGTKALEKLLEDLKNRLYPNEPPKQGSVIPPSTGETVQTKTANGLHTVTFDTLQGRVIVKLPDDMMAGDTISGTVMLEPKGKTSEEKENNRKLIEGWAIELDGGRATTSKPQFTWTPRMPLTPGQVRYQLKIVEILPGQTPSERTIATAQLPGMTPSGAVITPGPRTTSGFQFPALGQTGRPIVVSGPFDGSFENTNLRVGGEELPILAESPRQMVFQSPTNQTGPTEITLKEGNVETKGTYRNVGVNLTAPKTSLTKGESTTLTVAVSGLEGIKSPVPLHLDNLVPSVVKMEGGDAQTRSIKPAEVKADGTYQVDRTITGQQAGAFRVTATVVVFDVCLQDDDNGNSLLVSSTTGDYIFCPPPSAGMNPISINTIEDFSGGVTLATGSGDNSVPRAWFILEHNTADRRVLINLNAGFQSGTATVETSNPKHTFTITDRDTRNNTCTCR